HSSPNLLSFTVEKTETLANAYTEMYFYNLDLNKSRQLTLEDVLGKDYKQIVDNSVAKQIAERKKDENNVFFEKEEGGFTGINKDQNFIVNQEGQVVIVFNKYEIAPGCMGIQEFPINAPLMIDAK
ncbi:MAG: RsiV family protein, partial [Clostridiales bacterium]